MVSVDSQPFSSCAMISALITADCFWSGGYFATSLSIRFKEESDNVIAHSPVDVPEYDVDRADDGDRVGEHVPLGQLVHGREVAERGRAQLHAVGLVGPVGDEVDAELPLR